MPTFPPIFSPSLSITICHKSTYIIRTFIFVHVSNNRKFRNHKSILSPWLYLSFISFGCSISPFSLFLPQNLENFSVFPYNLKLPRSSMSSLSTLLNVLLCCEFGLLLKIMFSLKSTQVVAHFCLFIFQLRKH